MSPRFGICLEYHRLAWRIYFFLRIDFSLIRYQVPIAPVSLSAVCCCRGDQGPLLSF